jgi:hypothetical protein
MAGEISGGLADQVEMTRIGIKVTFGELMG